jgi:hypothetical protein
MVSIKSVAVGACIAVITVALLLIVDLLVFKAEQDYMRISIVLLVSLLMLVLGLWFLYGFETASQGEKVSLIK